MRFGRPAWRIREPFLFLIALLVLWMPAPASAQGDTPSLDEISLKIEESIRSVLDTTGIPAISIALIRNNEVVWEGAYGLANVATGAKATIDTYFSTGSTLKAVTATAVMQLVEAGAFTLDTPLNEIVGSRLAIPGADEVTIRHLLSHQSGLEVPIDRVPLWGRDSPLGLEETFAQSRRIRPPGEEHRYCNGCFSLLEYVIEKASGMPYDQYVALRILQPLGIDIPSASIPNAKVVERMAIPYEVSDGIPTAVSQVRYNGFAPGDAYLRAGDMARFLASQLNAGAYQEVRILDEASVSEMQKEQLEGSNYGFGLSLREFGSHATILHNGSIPGFKAVMMGDPESGVGVYVVSNATQAERAINLLAWYAMMLLWGEDVPSPLG